MLPNLDINLLMATLLGADTTTYNAAALSQNILHLVLTGPTPAPTVVPSDCTFADLVTGINPPICLQEIGAVVPGYDPATQNVLLDIPPDVGGYSFLTDNTFVGPLTVIGFMLTDSAITKNLGYALFDSAITLTGKNQRIVVQNVEITLLASSLS